MPIYRSMKPFCSKEFSFQEYPYLGREVYSWT